MDESFNECMAPTAAAENGAGRISVPEKLATMWKHVADTCDAAVKKVSAVQLPSVPDNASGHDVERYWTECQSDMRTLRDRLRDMANWSGEAAADMSADGLAVRGRAIQSAMNDAAGELTQCSIAFGRAYVAADLPRPADKAAQNAKMIQGQERVYVDRLADEPN